jgi:hypothetical protein
MKIKNYCVIEVVRLSFFLIIIIFLYMIYLWDAYYIFKNPSFICLFFSWSVFELLYYRIYKPIYHLQKFLTLIGILILFLLFGLIWIRVINHELIKDILEIILCMIIFIGWLIMVWEWYKVVKKKL